MTRIMICSDAARPRGSLHQAVTTLDNNLGHCSKSVIVS